MFRRVLPLAATVTFLLPGCWAWSPANTTAPKSASLVSAEGLSGGQQIDLTGGKAVREGFGRFKIEMGLAAQSRANRHVAAVGPDQMLLIFVTRADGSEVDDENGKDAIYTATVTGSTATVALPGLPMTTSVIGGTSGNPYTINALVGNWDNVSVPASSAAAYTTFKAGGTALLQYGSAPAAGKFSLTNLFKDIKMSYQWVGSSETTLFPNGRLLQSGYGRTEVTPGLVPTVTIDNYDHTLADFANNVDGGATATAKARANVVSLGSLAPSGSTLKLRHPGLALDTIDATGGVRKVRYIIGLQDDAASFGGTMPHLNIKTYNQDTGLNVSGVNIDADFAAYSPNGDTSNAGYNLANELAYVDVNMGPINTGSDTAKNIVDFTLTNVPGTAGVKLYMIPLGANSVMSGPFSSNIF